MQHPGVGFYTDSGVFPSLPLWGRWQPEGLTDEGGRQNQNGKSNAERNVIPILQRAVGICSDSEMRNH